MRLLLATALLVACGDPAPPRPDLGALDGDGDGYANRYDCNDDDPTIHPGADEYCDGIDNDCDSRVDEDAVGAPRWYPDLDRDGWGDATGGGSFPVACEAPGDGHYASRKGDCDDQDAGVNPAAMEICGDRVDNDCDGLESEEDANTDPASFGTWYLDMDGDGWGQGDVALRGCRRPAYDEPLDTADPDFDEAYPPGWVGVARDCDDSDRRTYPGAGFRENSPIVAAACVRDADEDGFGDATALDPITRGTDCNDNAPWIFLTSRVDVEICDGADSNCNGGPAPEERDEDGDGYVGCDLAVDIGAWLGSSTIVGGGDCDDTDPLKNPAAAEICNFLDDDCDGLVDESDAVDQTTWYEDGDGDGYGNAAVLVQSCSQPPGFVDLDVTGFYDCDDSNAAISPAAYERCATVGIDDDCDGQVDESDALGASTWYQDFDADGFGNPGVSAAACTQPTGFVSSATDCNDLVGAINPSAVETCNGIDDDCDGAIDAADSNVVGDIWYADVDGDGYGSPTGLTRACGQPTAYVGNSDDCDDGAADINPDATEVCRDYADNDCDGSANQCSLEVQISLSAVDGAQHGASSGAAAGSALNGMPDQDGDGLRELLVGVPGDSTGGTEAGALWLTFGALSTSFDATLPDVIYTGSTVGYRAGASMVGASNLAGGATADLAIGSCPGSSAADTRGAVHFFFDIFAAVDESLDDADLALVGQSSSDLFGCSMALGGDYNGDTAVDLIIGAPGSSAGMGGFWVLSGPVSATTTLSTSGVRILGVTTSDAAGSVVAANQDVDGDGSVDILLGAAGAGGTKGRGYVVLGPVTTAGQLSSLGIGLLGQSNGDAAGTGVAFGDINDDGYADILVGAPGRDDAGVDSGTAYLVYGPVTADRTLLLADARFDGSGAGAMAGQSVANAGDLDGDEIPDFAIGAPGATINGVAGGGAYLLLSSQSFSGTYGLATGATGRLSGITAGDAAGSAVVGLGDLTGDGFGDLGIGAPAVDGSFTDEGAAYILFGNSY